MSSINKDEELFITIDQSTVSTKGFLFSSEGKIIEEYSLPHKQYYPKPGWVEHDPKEIFNNTVKIIEFLVRKAGSSAEKLAGITITNQRESVVFWDKKTGEPMYNALVWQCTRGIEICESIKAKGYEKIVKEKTGLIVDPYFSASKIKWFLNNIRCDLARLLVGTIDSWLVWKLTDGEVHATDYSNASRTMLFNIKSLDWDDEILELFDIPRTILPRALASNANYGYTRCGGLFKHEIPVNGVAGDSQASAFGQGCFEKGAIKATYGTGSSIILNIGNEFIVPPQGIVTSIGWGIDGEVTYVFEGNVHATGATIKWLIENAGILRSFDEVENICLSVSDSEGVYFVPAFSGLGAPYWESKARALIWGLTLKTTREHVVRAAVESIAYQIRDVIEVLARHAGVKINELRADGGASRNDFLMQFQADILGVPVLRAGFEDMSAFGSFLIGLLGLKRLRNLEDAILLVNKIPKTSFYPKLPENEREKKYEEWTKIVLKSIL